MLVGLLASCMCLFLSISAFAVDAPKHFPKPDVKPLYHLPDKSLHMRSTHTGEEINIVFWKDGAYVKDALLRLNYFLRDHRTNDVKAMDPELFMLVSRLYNDVGGKGAIEIISGHRSKKTNNMLRKQGRKVAKKSQHVKGTAMDIRIPNVPLKIVRDTALSYGLGGVGYYSRSNFVHVDTGRPRFW